MKTALKIIAGLLSIVLILIAIAALLLSTMVHSHWLKDQISEYAKSTTGRDLIIKGDFHASFWPRLGITVDHVSLSNPKGFSGQTFLTAQHLTIDAELMPLLHRQLIVNHASLRDAVINLEKNASSHSNWEFKSTGATSSEKNSQDNHTEEASMKFDIASLSLIRTTINYKNVQSNKALSFADVNLTAKNAGTDKPFPLQGNFTFVSSDNKRTGIKINTLFAYEESADKITLNNMALGLKINRHPEIDLSGNLVSELSKASLIIPDLTLKIGSLKLTGTLVGNNLSERPSLSGHVNSNSFNLRKLISSNSSSLNLKNKHALSQVKFDSNIQLTAEKIRFNDLNATVDGNNVSGNIEYSFSPKPYLGLSLIANNFNVQDYLPNGGSSKLTGKASVNLSIRGSGSGDNFKRSLSGDLGFNITNGVIIGTDIDYQVDQAIAKYTQRAPTLSDRGQTSFSQLSGSANISNGLVNTPHLELLTPTLRVQSSGKLNLVSNDIDYKLSCRLLSPQKISTEYLGAKINADLSNYDIPAKIGCTLNNPCVGVDLGGVLKLLAKEGTKAAARTVIEKHLLKNVDPKVGKVLDQLFQKRETPDEKQ